MREASVRVVLSGPPGSGKSTVGRALAARLGVRFEDTDARIEHARGCTVREVFAREGEAAFRALEQRVLRAALDAPGALVLATGGGALLDAGVRRGVLREAWVVALEAPLDVLVARCGAAGDGRPLLAGDVSTRLRALLDARREAYAEAHATLSTERGTPDELAAAIERAVADLARHHVRLVPLGARSYPVVFAPLASLAERVASLAPSAVVSVTDRVVAKLAPVRSAMAGMNLRARVVLRTPGERGKTLRSVGAIWDAALEAGVDRDAIVLGIGGGVVTDLAGFAAATLLRGVRCASAPTTLLAMVDASVGGKTGFDHARGKNLLGAFHQPSLVLCDPAVLATLADRDIRAGLAEVVKVALVRDAGLLATLESSARALARRDPDAIARILPPAVSAKIDVVAADEREAGSRALLNFGHTLGHALESAAEYAVPHGECVALGMRAALWLGVRQGVTPADVARRGEALLDALDLPRRMPVKTARGRVLSALASDKKRRAGALRFVFCDGAGTGVLREVTREQARSALARVL